MLWIKQQDAGSFSVQGRCWAEQSWEGGRCGSSLLVGEQWGWGHGHGNDREVSEPGAEVKEVTRSEGCPGCAGPVAWRCSGFTSW